MTEESRSKIRVPLGAMIGIGVIASAIGIALGLIINWFPTQGSSQADKIDTLYHVLIIVSVPVFVGVTIMVLASVYLFRMRPGEEDLDGPPIHGNTRLEVVWTTIPAVVLVALCSYAYVALTDIEEAKDNEMRVNVTGQQFAWTFEYPKQEGMAKAVKSEQLYLPKDRPVRFYVKSLDVIHDFWVPAFRMKVDAVPGITTKYRVTPIKNGRFPVVCAELCGPGHAFMRQTATVVTDTQFASWLQKQASPNQATGGGGGGGGAAEGGSGGGGGETAAIDAKSLFANGNGDATSCGACHTLADAQTTGTTGPDLDKVLKGQSAAEIEESIVDPGAKPTPDFPDGVMPPNYGDTLSPEELKALVDYLVKVAAG